MTVKQFSSTFDHKKGVFEVPKSYLQYKNFKLKVLQVAQKELKEKNDIYFDFEEIKVNNAVKRLLITIKQNGEVIKKNFADKKRKELQSTTKHKQVAQEQIKRLMSRNKDKIKDKFEKAYPQEKALLESDIIHMHLRRNGKEKFVLFGVDCGSVFYVLAFDPGHDFDKRV